MTDQGVNIEGNKKDTEGLLSKYNVQTDRQMIGESLTGTNSQLEME
jgi:hypothetical protein